MVSHSCVCRIRCCRFHVNQKFYCLCFNVEVFTRTYMMNFSLPVSSRQTVIENITYNSLILQMEGLRVTKMSKYPIFFFLLLTYVFILSANMGIVILIWTERSLHQPMYLLFCNLSINDIMGNSLLVPRVLADILVPPSERLIHYYECLMQAFTTHMFGTNAHTVLMIMAFDRYVAICNPLHYTNVMTDRMVLKLTVSAWGVAFVLVAVLLGLTIRLNRCRTLIMNPYCDNASLFKLSCENVFINNVYGLTFTVVLLSASISSIILTYSKITAACVISKSKSLNSKAMRTCSTHLCLYMIMLVSGMILITLHRFPEYSEYRKISAILFNVVPGSLNPVIYGLTLPGAHLSLLTNQRSSSMNITWEPDAPPFFIIQGLADLGGEKMILFVILLLGYIIILASRDPSM